MVGQALTFPQNGGRDKMDSRLRGNDGGIGGNDERRRGNGERGVGVGGVCMVGVSGRRGGIGLGIRRRAEAGCPGS